MYSDVDVDVGGEVNAGASGLSVDGGVMGKSESGTAGVSILLIVASVPLLGG